MVNHPNRGKHITRRQAAATLRKIERDLEALRVALRAAETGSGLATWAGSGGDAAHAAERVSGIAYEVAAVAVELDE